MWFKKFLFTGFFTGYSPVAPGTAGTAAAMALYFLEYYLFGEISWIINIAVVIAMFFPAIWLGSEGEKYFGVKDPPQVVLDEVMGYWISVMFYSFSVKIALLAFLLFRIMDIVKPFPIRRFEILDGGTGIMLDDYLAGIYANLIILALINVQKYYNFTVF